MINYKATKTGMKVHNSKADIIMEMGPFGSGKSTTMAMHLLLTACDQPLAPDGVRYSKFGVVRGVNGALRDTTRDILMRTLPKGDDPNNGYITRGGAPYSGTFRFMLKDKSQVQMELLLYAMEDEKSMQHIRSANWTAAWINEANEISREVLETVISRVGRYPPKDLGGCKWGGVLMDFNPYSHGHWLDDLFKTPYLEYEDEYGNPVKSYIDAFVQPPAAFKIVHEDGRIEYKVNPEAENLENLKGGTGYYGFQIALRKQKQKYDEIDSLFCLQIVPPKKGRLVWPNFSRDRHVAKSDLTPIVGQPVVVGFDTSGLQPACVFMQLQYGRWCVLDELYGSEMGLELFLTGVLIPFVRQNYSRCPILVSCDPANARDSWTGVAPTTRLKEAGFEVALKVVNSIQTRIDIITYMLNMDYGGLMISPHCKYLIEAMESGYHYIKHRLRGSVEEVYSVEPAKNDFSHIADALQYGGLHVSRPLDADETATEIKKQGSKHNSARRGIAKAA